MGLAVRVWRSGEKSELRYKFGIPQHMDGFNVTRLDETSKGVSMDQGGERSMDVSQGHPNTQRLVRGLSEMRRIPDTGHPERQGKSISWERERPDAVTGQVRGGRRSDCWMW